MPSLEEILTVNYGIKRRGKGQNQHPSLSKITDVETEALRLAEAYRERLLNTVKWLGSGDRLRRC